MDHKPPHDVHGKDPEPVLSVAGTTITVVRNPITPLLKPTVIGVFPAASSPNPKQITLGPGNVSLLAGQLATGTPANSLTGFAIKSGTLTFQANFTVVAGVIHLAPTELMQLEAALNPPPAPPAGTGPGGDARAAVVHLPASVTIQFGPGGGHITKLDPFSATVYNTAVTLNRNATAPSYDAALGQILVPADVSPAGSFAIAKDLSALLSLSGSAPVARGAWALPVPAPAPGGPAGAFGAGSVAILLGSGINGTWSGAGQVLTAQTTTILAAPGQIVVVLHFQTTPFSETFQLWQEAGGGRNSTIEFDYPARFTLLYFSKPGEEELRINGGSAVAHLDRPRRADGALFALTSPSASIAITLTATGSQLTITGALQQPPNNPLIPLAIENALLHVHAPAGFSLAGALNAATVSSGSLTLTLAVHAIIPALPDPYASSVPASTLASRGGDPGSVTGTITWTTAANVQLAFSFQQNVNGPFPVLPSLLDVSSNADQLGLMSASDVSALTISGLTLQAPCRSLAVFTVPEISWEPMVLDPATPPPVPPPGSTTPPDDGGPSRIRVATVQLVPVSPAVVAATFVNSIASGAPTFIDLTLPFGLRASITGLKGGTIELNQPAFPGSLTGGIQIKMLPASPGSSDASFTGKAFPTDPYGKGVLFQDPGLFFDQEFNTGPKARVPLRRYDFSGYGASVFSDWRDPNPPLAAVIKVQFDVFVGRTAYEVVEIQSYIYHYIIKVVRTITIERTALGGIIRHDSGWQAASDGLFQFPNPPGTFAVHRGAVAAVVKVRNIRDNGSIFPLTGKPQWRPVLFDADILLDPGLTIDLGASGPNMVASRDMTGYLLETVGFTPGPVDVVNLLASHQAGGPVSCTVTIANSGAHLRASGVDGSAFLNGAQGVVVNALRGSPVLPPDGAWSIGKRATFGTTPPLPLDPNFPVPLIKNSGIADWFYADPSDVLALSTPGHEYGLLQSTGTQKLFFAQPKITPNVKNITPQVPPHLADVGALLNAVGVFPDLKAALKMTPPFPGLDTTDPNGVKFTKDFFTTLDGTLATAALPSQTLIDFGANVLQLKLAYQNDKGAPGHAFVNIQPGSWSVQLKGISFPVISAFGKETDPLLRIVGDVLASSSSAPTLSNLTVVYGGALGEVQQVFSNLEQLASFLPGAPFSRLDVHFSDGKLTIRDEFALPELPLGIGFIQDVALDLGMSMQLSPQTLQFTAGIGSEQKPFHWLVSPLSGTGAVVVGMANGAPTFLVQGGLGVGLSIDIGIAQGSASIVLQIQISTEGALIHLKALLTGQASVDVLEGLASASLTLTAGLGITPRGGLPPTSVDLTASVQVGIHISICWVVHVDFDGYWQYTQSVDVPSVGSVIPV